MKSVTTWMKSNPLIVVLIILSLGAIGFFIWVQMASSPYKDEVLSELQKKQQVDRFSDMSVQVPSALPDGKPRTFTNVVINQQAIAGLQRHYAAMSKQHDELEKFVDQRNQGSHQVLIPNLFSDPKVDQNDTSRYQARTAYIKALRVMLRNADAVSGTGDRAKNYPQLNAGMPVSADDLKNVVQQVDTQLKNESFNLQKSSGGTGSTGNAVGSMSSMADGSNGQATMSLADQQRIHRRKQAALIDAVESRAKSIPIYADTKASTNDSDYPLMVNDELKPHVPPNMAQLWEGQIELWIQQDVIQAIIKTNQEANPGGNELGNPIKRLIKMRVVPGYVGLQTAGAMPIDSSSDSNGGSGAAIHFFSSGQKGDADAAIGGQASLDAFFSSDNKVTQASNGTYPPPASGQQASGSTQAVPIDFHLSPTGRVSNALYDVRQVKVSLILDYRQLPLFFNNLSKVNFMTVLSCGVHAVNPYAALAQGYDYGQGNIVRVDLLIETLWMRSWTSKLMPKLVREYLGIDAPTDLTSSHTAGAAMHPSGTPGQRAYHP